MVKYRKYDSHLEAVKEIISDCPNLSKRQIICLNPYLDHNYILKNELYDQPILFKANPNTFDDDFLSKCFISNSTGTWHYKSIFEAIKTQNVSESFIVDLLDKAERKKGINLYYDVLHLASSYVKLSEKFIKEYIIDDDEVNDSTLINVVSNQPLSESFIEENLIEWLNLYRCWEGRDIKKYCEGGEIKVHGWKFLFQNPNATISEGFFKRHNLMDLNLAMYLLYAGYDEIGNEYNHIDLSHFSFNYLYKIFTKACKDVKEYMNIMDYPIDYIDIHPVFMSFGNEFVKTLIETKIKNKNFPIKKLYPGCPYPFDRFYCDFFESFVLNEAYVSQISIDFNDINDLIFSVYNPDIYGDQSEKSDKFLCWWICSRTQKVSVPFLMKIIDYENEHTNIDEYKYGEDCFELTDFPANRYLTEDHIVMLKKHNMFDYDCDWLDNYEFTLDKEFIEELSIMQISKTKFTSESDLLNYCNFVFETDILTHNDKYCIFGNIVKYNTDFLNSITYEYFVSYVKEIHEDNHRSETEALIMQIIAFANITSEEIEKILYLFSEGIRYRFFRERK